MGLVLPEIIDEALDLIGVSWPNVDEDDYFEMATAMRSFAEKFEGHGGDAHAAINRILGSSEGYAVDAMQKHWSHVKTNHLEKIPEVARLFADACDAVGEIIRGMKVKAGVELAVLAGTIVAELAAAPFTLGISAAVAAGEIALLRTLVKKLVDEAVDQIVSALITKVSEPVTAKLQELVEDMVLDLAEGAFHPSDGKSPDSMTLASAGDEGAGSGSSGKATRIDHVEFEDGAGKVSRHGSDMGSQSDIHLTSTKSHFGRTKGRDAFTAPFDHMLEGALEGFGNAARRTVKHVSQDLPERVKSASSHQKRKDHDVRDETDRIDVKKPRTGDSEQRTYLLHSDGSVQRLHKDGRTEDLDDHDRTRLDGIVRPDNTFHVPNSRKEKDKYRTPGSHTGRADSEKIDPATSDLAQATQAARVARKDGKGTNYATGRYFDAEGRENLLVGYSGKPGHSERMIGRPIIDAGRKDGLTEIFTEREPCRKPPKCSAWLDDHFPDVKVTHVADYYNDAGKTTNKEHTRYLNGLKKVLPI